MQWHDHNHKISQYEYRYWVRVIRIRSILWMHQCGYVTKQANKAFAKGVSGSVEVGAMAQAVMDEARDSKRELAIGEWDVKSAYPNTGHLLVQHQFWYYHVPTDVCEEFHQYYESLFGYVKSERWTTGWVRMEKGLMQGCPFSCCGWNDVFSLPVYVAARNCRDTRRQVKSSEVHL
jgi:hypothetical protein